MVEFSDIIVVVGHLLPKSQRDAVPYPIAGSDEVYMHGDTIYMVVSGKYATWCKTEQVWGCFIPNADYGRIVVVKCCIDGIPIIDVSRQIVSYQMGAAKYMSGIRTRSSMYRWYGIDLTHYVGPFLRSHRVKALYGMEHGIEFVEFALNAHYNDAIVLVFADETGPSVTMFSRKNGKIARCEVAKTIDYEKLMIDAYIALQ